MNGSVGTTITPRKEDEHRRIRPSSDDRSPPALDEAILRASRRAVRFHRFTVLLEKPYLSQKGRRQLAFAFALGLIVGIGLVMLVGDKLEAQSVEVTPTNTEPAVDAITPILDNGINAMPSPEVSLQAIAAMVLEGRVAEAESQLRTFRQRYPDLEVTPRQSSLAPELQNRE
jgi:hypothetical protein